MPEVLRPLQVLRLVLVIAAEHVALAGAACTLLHACLVHEPPSDSDSNALTIVALRRRLLDGLLLLLARGHVIPVLTTLLAWIPDADLSLVRHLLAQLLQLASPPYSAPFAEKLLAMVRHPRTLEAHKGAESKRPLITFVQQALDVVGIEDTAEEVLAFLQTAP